jgi:uncharacterized iron-regulated protein
MPEPVVARIPGATEAFHRNQIVDLRSGKAVSFDDLMDDGLTKDILFVGEIHDDPEHHLLQVQILQAFLGRSTSAAIAMEFFQQDQQAVLDRYTLEDMTEEAFLKEINWKKTWGYPYHFYRPLLLAAKQRGIRILALNAPRAVVRKVAREGLGALDEEEQTQIPGDMDLGNESHRAYVRDAYEDHEKTDLKDFEFFYQAQVVWEETMARNLAEFLMTQRRQVIVFCGNGHIVRKFGIPERVQRRLPVSVVTVMPFPLPKTVTLERDLADYLWLTGH